MLPYILSLVAVVVIVKTWRQYHDGLVSTRRFVFWLLFWLALVGVSWAPQVTDRISDLVGVGRGVDLFLFIAVVFLNWICFSLYTRLERTRQEVTELVRTLAIRDAELADGERQHRGA